MTRLFQTAVLTGNMNDEFIEKYIYSLSDNMTIIGWVDKTSQRKESIFNVYYQVSEFYNKLR